MCSKSNGESVAFHENPIATTTENTRGLIHAVGDAGRLRSIALCRDSIEAIVIFSSDIHCSFKEILGIFIINTRAAFETRETGGRHVRSSRTRAERKMVMRNFARSISTLLSLRSILAHVRHEARPAISLARHYEPRSTLVISRSAELFFGYNYHPS